MKRKEVENVNSTPPRKKAKYGDSEDDSWGESEKTLTIIFKGKDGSRQTKEYDFTLFEWAFDTGNLDRLLAHGSAEIDLSSYPCEAADFIIKAFTDENSDVPSTENLDITSYTAVIHICCLYELNKLLKEVMLPMRNFTSKMSIPDLAKMLNSLPTSFHSHKQHLLGFLSNSYLPLPEADTDRMSDFFGELSAVVTQKIREHGLTLDDERLTWETILQLRAMRESAAATLTQRAFEMRDRLSEQKRLEQEESDKSLKKMKELSEHADAFYEDAKYKEALEKYQRAFDDAKETSDKLYLHKQLILCNLFLKRLDAAISLYKALLRFLKTSLSDTRRESIICEEILSKSSVYCVGRIGTFHEITLQEIDDDDPVYFRIAIKACKFFLTFQALHDKGQSLLDSLLAKYESMRPPKADPLIQIYGVKVENMFRTGDTSQLADVYHKIKHLQNSVGDHRSVPTLSAIFGRYLTETGEYDKAYVHFFQALKYADYEAGRDYAKYCLLVSLLRPKDHQVDVLAGREVKIFQEIDLIKRLYIFARQGKRKEFDDLVEQNRSKLNTDPWIPILIQRIQDSWV